MKIYWTSVALMILWPAFVKAMGAKWEIENPEERHNIVKEALESLEGFSNNLFARKVTKVESVSKQMVAGILYTIDFELGVTHCVKTDKQLTHEKLHQCKLKEEIPPEKCSVKIWSQPWKKLRSVTQKVCQQVRNDVSSIATEAVPTVLGGDGHDQLPHGKILGGDDHDQLPHGKVLGGDDHDQLPHGKILGGDDHDQLPHGKVLGGDDHDQLPHGKILGGDDHDQLPHGKILGGDDHDQLPHGKVLGGDDHDQLPHGKILGGDGHDQLPHGKILGDDGHDQLPHDVVVDITVGQSEAFDSDPDLGLEKHNIQKKILTSVNPVEDKPVQPVQILEEEIMPLLSRPTSQRQLRKLQSHYNFKQFVKAHNKQYATQQEYQKRFSIFRENMKKVQFLRESERGTAEYGSSPFADLTEEEFRKQKLGLAARNPVSGLPRAEIPDVELPAEYDWRHYNAVTPVKNQGSCGSCWAFSVTGNVEGVWKLRTGELLSLSEQELVDCDKLDNGCNGGLPENAYKAIVKLGGLESEDDYVYDGLDEKCHFNKSMVRATITGGVSVSSNETEMAQWLMKNGPISIGINANAMQFYMGGISHPFKFLCPSSGIDHGVLIVGFGIHHYPLFKRDMPFWIVKNSWGTSWGEQGYYRVYRGDGTCGVNEMATSAVVA